MDQLSGLEYVLLRHVTMSRKMTMMPLASVGTVVRLFLFLANILVRKLNINLFIHLTGVLRRTLSLIRLCPVLWRNET